ncbi:hypothetical protein BJ170DRAFT_678004 [Xylariales sp. AK1849]|nr:hypothetical protein BJ170DRAFT_678004 [Xylariales sp. AK1849]
MHSPAHTERQSFEYRCFHVSAPVRAAADDDNPNNGSRDSDDKPDNNKKDEDSQEVKKDENLLGENGVNGNGDSQGRRRRSNGFLRTRAVRNRNPEELPPFHLPADFQERHIYRHDSEREDPLGDHEHNELTPKISEEAVKTLEESITAVAGLGTLEETIRRFSSIFDATAFTASDVQELQKGLRADNAFSILQRGGVTVVAASYLIACRMLPLAKDSYTMENILFPLQRPELGRSLAKFYEMLAYFSRMLPGDHNAKETSLVLRNMLRSTIRFRDDLGPLHHDLLLEAMSSIRADFAINPPKAVKTSDLKRPVTLINFPYYSGSLWPQHIVQDIAAEVEADVLHLSSQDIARIIGPYLGQDVTRAPGPLSLLGYKAAENAGRTHRPSRDQVETGYGHSIPLSIVFGMEKPKKDSKKKLTVLDHVFGESNRGKSDEMWEDLKVNAVLEELIHTADFNTPEQRPLIVHVHDYNAMNMDEECGAVILSKLRKVIDTLWSEGRKIVLVGSCSMLNAPGQYIMKGLESTERVVTLYALGPPGQKDVEQLPTFLALHHLQAYDYIEENAKNIGHVLDTLLNPSYNDVPPQINFNIHIMREEHRLRSLSESVLPLTEVYRIAKTMIGLRRHQPEPFDQAVLEEALRLIKNIDEAKEHILKAKEAADGEIRSNSMGGMMGGPFGDKDNHEERFLSALVNPKDIKTTFNDIHAPRETIESIKMLTQLSLLRPEAFSYGVLSTDRIPGCLLYGPPGTGKTLLAKAVAKESGANMIEISGASINNMYLGESEKNVRAIFRLAKTKEPLVIFIDEADALLGARGRQSEGAARRDIINQFLREWDGMDTMKAFIMVATNRPFDLDEAVLRRLPRKLLVDLPLEEDRAAILRIHLKGEALDDTVSIEEMAKQTLLYSGSDLKNVCVAAAMAAVKEELEAAEKHTGSSPYSWVEKRVLNRRHFDKALVEIPASASEDMSTLNAIKKFDERYGERKTRRKKRGMGFEVMPEATDSNEARVRSAGSLRSIRSWHIRSKAHHSANRNLTSTLSNHLYFIALTNIYFGNMSDNLQDFDFSAFLGANDDAFDLGWPLPVGEEYNSWSVFDNNDNPIDFTLPTTLPIGEEVDLTTLQLGGGLGLVEQVSMDRLTSSQTCHETPIGVQAGVPEYHPAGVSQGPAFYKPSMQYQLMDTADHAAGLQSQSATADVVSGATSGESIPDNRPSLSCNACHKKFDSKELLSAHRCLYQHSIFPCSVSSCNASFIKKSDLRAHLREAHVPGHYLVGRDGALAEHNECSECGAVLKSLYQLQRHATSEKHSPFRCACDIKFARIDVLNRHIDSYIKDIPKFPCTFCKFHQGRLGFRRRDHLVQHLRGYHNFDSDKINKISPPLRGPRELVWRICPHTECEFYRDYSFQTLPWTEQVKLKPFEKQAHLTKHLKEVHDETSFPCDVPGCNRVGAMGYVRERDLMKHRFAEHPEADEYTAVPRNYVYKCPYLNCGKGYSSATQLFDHKIFEHWTSEQRWAYWKEKYEYQN